MEKKILIGIALVTALTLGGGVLFMSNLPSKAVVEKTAGATLTLPHTSYDFKEIKYSSGLAEHSFPIKNTGSKDLVIANLATSCACSKVYFKNTREQSERFGMKGMSAPSDWKGIIKPGETAEIVAIFDPTFHGPQGIGPISRIVSFETNDVDHPYAELAFNGTVVK